jgi:NADPH2:quinone reductase
MKAAVLGDNGLEIRDVPKPMPKADEVLVRVRASGLNRADLLMSAGHKHGNLGGAGTVAGLEWSGEVAGVGANVRGIRDGDRVMCAGSGGYAEYAVTDHGRVFPIPANNLSYEEAATLPVGLTTMHDAIVTNGRLQPGETILVQGASSGVGLLGMQIAKQLGARLVIGSSTNAEKRARLGEYGADLAIDSRDPAWPDQVKAATDGKGVNLIIDQISILGRIVNVGRLGGFSGEFDFDLHALKRISYIGVTFRTRSVDEVREIGRRMRADLWQAIEAGSVRLPIDRMFPLDEAEAAQAHMRANAHFGKIVLYQSP